MTSSTDLASKIAIYLQEHRLQLLLQKALYRVFCSYMPYELSKPPNVLRNSTKIRNCDQFGEIN